MLQEIAEEFSHTAMHGAVIKRALPPGVNRPQPVKASNIAGMHVSHHPKNGLESYHDFPCKY